MLVLSVALSDKRILLKLILVPIKKVVPIHVLSNTFPCADQGEATCIYFVLCRICYTLLHQQYFENIFIFKRDSSKELDGDQWMLFSFCTIL